MSLLKEYLQTPSGKNVKACFKKQAGIMKSFEMVQALWKKVCKSLPISCGDQDQEIQQIQQSQAKENEQKAYRKAWEVLIRSERQAADPQTNATRRLRGGRNMDFGGLTKMFKDGLKCIKDNVDIGDIVKMIKDKALKRFGELEEVAEE